MLTIKGYTLQELLYQGSRYSLHRALRTQDNQAVILKSCRLEQPPLADIAGLQHEHHLIHMLDIPGVIQAGELIQHQHQFVLVLEDIGGQSLHHYLQQKPLALDDFFNVALQLVDIIRMIHQRHIIHKDINPQNIIIEPTSLTIKLADFNIATLLPEESTEPTAFNQLEGTLPYISPEQTGRMNRPIDYRSDFYSLGMTLFELLTGQPAFTAQDPIELVHSHLAIVPPMVHEINPTVPQPLSAIVAKLLAKTPEARYSSIVGLKADLLTCQSQWEHTNHIEPFALGTKDLHDRLAISHKLYGRETAIHQLLDTFQEVAQGKTALLLVSGYSGIGKSSVVQEIQKPVVAQKAYFISGKFDQLQRATPYSALITAFQALAKQLLAEPHGRLEELKQRLLKALNNNGQVIIDVIPMMELILGPQPPLKPLSTNESQNRFTFTLQSFISALAEANHPLVLFLDDLQWIDSASLQLITLLLQDPTLTHCLIIGAYRDNEITPEHPLLLVLQQLKQANIRILDVKLTPLSQTHIESLVADSFSISQEEATPLAKLLLEKTQGNPFFINAFLKQLYHNKWLTFNYDTEKWQCDLTQIQQHKMTDNVVDLLSARIRELPESAQHLLQLAACIGHIFDLHTLAVIAHMTVTQVVKLLTEAIEIQLIKPLNENYRLIQGLDQDNAINLTTITCVFAHDKIQQAVYQLIPPAKLPQTHLQIGRLLLQQYPTLDNKTEVLFEILNHFNGSLSLISDVAERKSLAKYNLLAAQHAKAAIAYQAALNYLRAAETLLTAPTEDQELLDQVHQEMADCYYSEREFTQADSYTKNLLQHTHDSLKRSQIWLVKIKAYVSLAHYQEALELAREALKELGFRVPKQAYTLDILKQTLKIRFYSRSKKNRILIQAISAKIIATNALLTSVSSALSFTDRKLALLMTCKRLILAYLNGYDKTTPASCLMHAAFLIGQFKYLKEASRFINLAKHLELQIANSGSALYYFALGSYITPWYQSLDDCLIYFEKGYQVGIEKGELGHAAYNRTATSFAFFWLGKPLQEVNEDFERSVYFLQRARENDFLNCCTLAKTIIGLFIEKSSEKEASLNEKLQNAEKVENKPVLSLCYHIYCEYYYIFSDFEAALALARKTNELKPFIRTIFFSVFHILFLGLCLAKLYFQATPKQQKAYIKELYHLQKELKQWSVANPTYSLHYNTLLSAEITAIKKGFCTEAIMLYDEAIQLFYKSKQINFVAIANECAAAFYLRANRTQTAKTYLLNAHYAYQQWGALAKCQQLEQQYPEWFEISTSKTATTVHTTVSTLRTNLDSLSLVKFSQAISQEIHLEALLNTLLTIVLQHAGAERIVLLIKQDDAWFIEAEGDHKTRKVFTNNRQPVTNRADLPLGLLNYAVRAQSYILLQSPAEFAALNLEDQYLTQAHPQSILILPITYQGQLKNLLYLENSLTPYAFPMQNVETLTMMASQAATALENARLYYQATHDSLTGLANRNLLHYIFNTQTTHTQRAILFMDLDGFKKINDTLGHEVGDQLLQYFAEQLNQCARKEDLPVRLGGDEFVLLLNNVAEPQVAANIAEQLLSRLQQPITLSGHPIQIASSIGISLAPRDGDQIQILLRKADLALYHAKTHGKGRYQFFDDSIQSE